MTNQKVTLEQFNETHLEATKESKLGWVYARGKAGKILVGTLSHEPTVSMQSSKNIPETRELEVEGEPLQVLEKMLNELGVDNDFLTPAFLVSLKNAKNWCEKDLSPEKVDDHADLCENIDKLIERSTDHIAHNHNYFADHSYQKNYTPNLAKAVVTEDIDLLRRTLNDLKNDKEMLATVGLFKP